MPVFDMIETVLVKKLRFKPSRLLRFVVRNIYVGEHYPPSCILWLFLLLHLLLKAFVKTAIISLIIVTTLIQHLQCLWALRSLSSVPSSDFLEDLHLLQQHTL